LSPRLRGVDPLCRSSLSRAREEVKPPTQILYTYFRGGGWWYVWNSGVSYVWNPGVRSPGDGRGTCPVAAYGARGGVAPPGVYRGCGSGVRRARGVLCPRMESHHSVRTKSLGFSRRKLGLGGAASRFVSPLPARDPGALSVVDAVSVVGGSSAVDRASLTERSVSRTQERAPKRCRGSAVAAAQQPTEVVAFSSLGFPQYLRSVGGVFYTHGR
jgi:hypothetical protein